MSSDHEWYRRAVVYQVYIRSFCDGDGNGVGDLAGVRSKLDHLKDLGVDALWLTPFYRSPMVDHGYDVADPRDVDPLFGSLDEFDVLLADAHARDLRVIVDVVPNHTSDARDWFVEALASPPGSPARERFIFRPPARGGGVPNNWRSVFGGSAWSLDETSGEYYLHLFAPEQPDLNWRNPEVVADAEATLRFWLDRGVDGFRVDVAHGLFKDEALRDNPVNGKAVDGLDQWAQMEQRHTFDQPEVHDVYRTWRTLADGYAHHPVLIGEVFLWDPDRIARYTRDDELHLAFGFALAGQRWDATSMRSAVERVLGDDEARLLRTSWCLSNHDLPRHATRFGGGVVGRRRARAAALLLLGLPGNVTLYQGEELGLEDVPVEPALRQDPIWVRGDQTPDDRPGRDGCRTPMPWTSSPAMGFGFGSDDPWLPVPSSWGAFSVEAQNGDEGSMLALYRTALTVRRNTSDLQTGRLEWIDGAPVDVLAFTRGDVTVVVNLGVSAATVALDRPRRIALSSGDGVVAEGALAVVPKDTAVWLV